MDPNGETSSRLFDKQWATAPDPNPSPAKSANGSANGSSAGSPAKIETKEEFKLEAFDWSTAFVGSPKTVEKLKDKFGADLTEMVGVTSGTSFYLAPGPQLYVAAKEATHLKATAAPLCTHGGGSWLTGDKATKFENNNPDRGIPCKINSDLDGAIYED